MSIEYFPLNTPLYINGDTIDANNYPLLLIV